MTNIILSDGLKGGTGKSTVAIAVVDYLIEKGRLLAIDADPTNSDFNRQFDKTDYEICSMQAHLGNDEGWEDMLGAIEEYQGGFENIVVSLPAGDIDSAIKLSTIKSVFNELDIEIHQLFTVNRSSEGIEQFKKSGENGLGAIADKRTIVLNGYCGARDKFARWDAFFDTKEGAQFKSRCIYFPDLSDDAMDFLKENDHNQSFAEIAKNAEMKMFRRKKLQDWIADYKREFERAM